MNHLWKCPDCGAEASVDVWWYANNGTPMCGDCDIDMVPAEEQPSLRVIVDVQGGNVQEIAADEGVAVKLVDWDNIKAGDTCELPEWLTDKTANDGPSEVDEYLDRCRADIDDYNRRNEKGEP